MIDDPDGPKNQPGVLWPKDQRISGTTTRRFLERLVRAVVGPTTSGSMPIDECEAAWFTWGVTPFRFLVKDSEPALLVAQAVVSENVDCSVELLKELNMINAGVVSARLFYDRGWVIAQTETLLHGVTGAVANHLAWSVGSLADWAAGEFAENFEGDRYENPDSITVPSSQLRWG